MLGILRRRFVGVALAAAVAMGCHPVVQPSPAATVVPQGSTGVTPADQARREIEHPRYTVADVQFMSGMISHHQQAIVIAGWAASHGASAAVRTLCDRIIVSQTDEIKFMQRWLSDRHQAVPAADPRDYSMPGMDHPMLMPGMLTSAQMRGLDEARGPAFDRLLLTDMIMHHRGALEMVRQLPSAGEDQDDALAMYTTNVAADQSAEIGRMQRMLATLPAEGHAPDSMAH
jgi:uncharacterized protein (DUF305 family)